MLFEGHEQQNFLYSWTCEQLVCPISTVECPTSSLPCRPGLFGLSRDKIYPVISNYRTDDFEVGINSSLLQRGASYSITLSISRKAELLPAAIQHIPDFLEVSSTSVTFHVPTNTPVDVSIELCDSTCDSGGAITNVLGTGSRVILNATAFPTSQRPKVAVATITWSIVEPPNDSGLLASTAVMSSIRSTLLVLRAGSLVPNQPTSFRCTVVDTEGNVGYAETSVIAAIPPLGGMLHATPMSGIELNTSFQLQAPGWTADTDKLPLVYTFLATAGRSAINLTLADSNAVVVEVLLPAGSGPMSITSLYVVVSDVLGSKSSRQLDIVVSPFAISVTELNTVVQKQTTDLLRSGDMVAVQAVLGIAAASLAQACPASSLSACAEQASLDDRQVFRTQLLQYLEISRQSQAPSVAGALSRGAVLAIITEVPQELNFDGIPLGIAAVTVIVDEIVTSKGEVPDGFACAAAIIGIYNNLMASMMTIANAAGNSLRLLLPFRSRSFNEPVSWPVSGVQQKSSPGYKGDTNKSNNFNARAELLEEPDSNSLHEQFALLLIGLSQLSSLSVYDALIGELPRALSVELWDMVTIRVSTNDFPGYSAILDNAIVTIPANIFMQIDTAQMASPPGSAEIMLVQFRASPLPLHEENLGMPLIFQIRAFGSSVPLPLADHLATPFTLQLPWAGTLSNGPDKLGRHNIPFVGFFDTRVQVWDWTTDGVVLLSTSATTVTVSVQVFGTFASFGVIAGCDYLPGSQAVWDNCGVCKGDNGTCSGCDGIPNSGRSKNCSGHGRCVAGEAQCRCNDGWYGVECNTSCSLSTVCSGHGLCDPDAGLHCICLEGWVTMSPPPAYPGPFCSLSTATSHNITTASKADNLPAVLNIVLPAVAGGVLAIIAAYFLYTAIHRRRRPPQNKVINFRPTPHGIAPDEIGWESNISPPRAEVGEHGAARSFLVSSEVGFDDGQAAAAMAASLRAQVERRGMRALRQREAEMQLRISLGLTASRYDKGPDGPYPQPIEEVPEKAVKDDSDGDFARPIYLSTHPSAQVLTTSLPSHNFKLIPSLALAEQND